MSLTQTAERAALYKLIDYVDEDPEARIPKIMDTIDRYTPKDVFPTQRAAFRNAIDEQNNWYQLIMKIMDLNPAVRDAPGQDLRHRRQPHGLARTGEDARQAPAATSPGPSSLDPTSACNLHCTGCWAAEYGAQAQPLLRGDLDSIIEQGKELGMLHLHLHAAASRSCARTTSSRSARSTTTAPSSAFTNATLIDEAFCQGHGAREELRARHQRGGLRGRHRRAPRRRHVRQGRARHGPAARARAALRRLVLLHAARTPTPSRSEEYLDWMVEPGRAVLLVSSTYMPVGALRAARSSWPRPSSASTCTASSARCATRSRSSRWTSRTTASSWAAASPAGAATCTSTPPATWSRACSSTTPTRTSAT